MSYEEVHEESICLNEEKEIDSCLVVCFEEHEDNNGTDLVDTRLFVTYDHSSKAYNVNVIKNKRMINIVDFIILAFSRSNSLSYIMYNYNNLPDDACDMTYEFMESNMDRRYEIAAFDNVDIKRNHIKKLIRLTKNMYN